MIIELAGLPGSGKSTVVQHLCSSDPDLRSMIVTPVLPRDVPPQTDPKAGLVRTEAVRRDRAGGAWAKVARRKVLQDQLVPPATGSLLLEEGVVHHLWRTLFVLPSLTDSRWGPLLVSPWPLLVLEAPADVRIERVRGKEAQGPVNRQLVAGGSGGDDWRRADDLFERVVAAAPPERLVLRVSTEGDLAGTLERVREALARLRG